MAMVVPGTYLLLPNILTRRGTVGNILKARDAFPQLAGLPAAWLGSYGLLDRILCVLGCWVLVDVVESSLLGLSPSCNRPELSELDMGLAHC
jgi:hypothetical protein